MTVDNSHISKTRSDMPTMRIAVAGTGGLARLIGFHIVKETSHQVVFLSRTAQPQLSQTFRVVVVDYNDPAALVYSLKGIHTVISTIGGPQQVELIKASVKANVIRFAPSEFGGPPSRHVAENPLERGKQLTREWLAHYAQHIQSTIFVCGVFYERFQPGGLQRSMLGSLSGIDEEGDFLLNCRTMRAQALFHPADPISDSYICMTSAVDVARFVTKALDLPRWPPEMRMSGERITLRALLQTMQQLRGRQVAIAQWLNKQTLVTELRSIAGQPQHLKRQIQLHELLNIAESHYDYSDRNLNVAFPQIQPTLFQDWFFSKWSRDE